MAVALAGLFLTLLPGAASAAPIGKDGRILACYKVKGKPKGALRVLINRKARCKRGERRVVWSAVGAVGTTGSQGSAGSQGATGQAGESGTAGDPTLSAKISTLNLKVEGLEDLLAGVTQQQLTELVSSLLDVEALCEQATALTAQIGLLEGVVAGLGLNGVLEALGGLLEVPALPGALDPFACPSP